MPLKYKPSMLRVFALASMTTALCLLRAISGGGAAHDYVIGTFCFSCQ